jgi:uncharacterized protein (TIGR04255 family)
LLFVVLQWILVEVVPKDNCSMTQTLPKFDAPPVIETVLCIQFVPLPGFTAAHGGCFWQRSLAPDLVEWQSAKLAERPKIEDEFEDLGSKPAFKRMAFQLRPAEGVSRTQIIRSDEERMIQVQDTRFIYNWRKRQGAYPSYTAIKPDFDVLWERFIKYLDESRFPSPQPNQWEVTYVNHIPRGELWNEVSDWAKLLPSLYIPDVSCRESVAFETLGGGWQYRLANNRGRLHVSIQHGQTSEADRSEVLMLHLTARGPIGTAETETADAGFSLGHDAIVETFYRMTSDAAHIAWKERP